MSLSLLSSSSPAAEAEDDAEADEGEEEFTLFVVAVKLSTTC